MPTPGEIARRAMKLSIQEWSETGSVERSEDGSGPGSSGDDVELGATFCALFERTTTPMLVADDARRYRDANPAACRALKRPRETIVTLRIDDLALPEGRPWVARAWHEFLAAGTQEGEVKLRLPDGGVLEVQYSAVANFAPGRHLSMFPVPGAEVPELDLVQENPPAEPADAGLTPREVEVMTLLALGRTGTQIAEQLVLSPDTVRNHTRNARDKLGAKTRAQAVALALWRGEISI
jgi:DNA-binding CsgD family transcriptional regulator